MTDSANTPRLAGGAGRQPGRRGVAVCALWCGLFSLLVLSAGCSSEGGGGSGPTTTTGPVATPASSVVQVYQGDGPMRIVTTCHMVTDIVRNVAGQRAEVVGLMGEGVDPHLYKPTRNDVRQLMSADIIFYSGLMLEGRMADTFAQVARTGRPVYAVTENLDESFLREPPEFEGHVDPHVWMDVKAWSQCVQYVADVLEKFDPPHAAEYVSRAQAYRAELEQLDAYVRQAVQSVPQEQRVLITAHDAFGYFSRAYQIPVLSAQGISTESEAGVDDINRLVDEIVRRQVHALFVESTVSPKNLQAVIEGAANRGWKITVGGQLYSDATGPPGTYEGTYQGMLDHNATVIARALGGQAPPRGRLGKLSAETAAPAQP